MDSIIYRFVQNAHLRTFSRVLIFNYFRGFQHVFNLKMSSASNCMKLPDTLRGMKCIDREKFLRNVRVAVLKLPTDKLSSVISICKPYILKLENFKPVQDLSEEHHPFKKGAILHPEKVMCWMDVPEDHRLQLSKHDVTENNLFYKEIQLTYDNASYDDVFKAILPEGKETVSGFSQVGHIIHLNLRDHLLEYKSLIGTVLIDKIRTCRTVVNKTDSINNVYRNFALELIAGDEDYLVTVRENHCNFQFDFSKVYWNPRLGKEHERIYKLLKLGDVLFDVFAGVGPFAVPAAKKKCRVFANDLNPDSFKALENNAKHNSIKTCLFKAYNLDGKEFICKVFKSFIVDCCKGIEQVPSGSKIHVTMNLPALAVEFLKYFNGLIDDKELIEKFNLDIVLYVYCFVTGEDQVNNAKQKVIDNISRDVSSDILDAAFVRNVSPTKDMMRVNLQLTKEILFGIDSLSQDNEPPPKKLCVKSVEE